ncbi:hypothetical protein ACHAPI_011677 [Fusarium lateritium]
MGVTSRVPLTEVKTLNFDSHKRRQSAAVSLSSLREDKKMRLATFNFVDSGLKALSTNSSMPKLLISFLGNLNFVQPRGKNQTEALSLLDRSYHAHI